MEDLTIQYNRAIDPSKLFSSIQEVEDFMDIDHSIEDLKCFLRVCEEKECYEICAVIFKRLKEEIREKELSDKISCFLLKTNNNERKTRKTIKSQEELAILRKYTYKRI